MCFLSCQVEAITEYAKNAIASDADYETELVGLIISIRAAEASRYWTNDSLRQVRIGADVLYNWERGKWHPFVGGGINTHALRLKDNGVRLGDSENQLGVSGLGGVEYFFRRRTSLKFEGRALFIDDVFGLDPGGFSGTAGVKWYF